MLGGWAGMMSKQLKVGIGVDTVLCFKHALNRMKLRLVIVALHSNPPRRVFQFSKISENNR